MIFADFPEDAIRAAKYVFDINQSSALGGIIS
jgi:hypothetical protein